MACRPLSLLHQVISHLGWVPPRGVMCWGCSPRLLPISECPITGGVPLTSLPPCPLFPGGLHSSSASPVTSNRLFEGRASVLTGRDLQDAAESSPPRCFLADNPHALPQSPSISGTE